MKIVNREDLAVGDIQDQMLEKRPLPIGKKQFEEWSDRIISGALINATPESLKFALASMLLHLGPTESFREDAYFILSLRKGAVNETAHAMMVEIKEIQEAKKKQAAATAPKLEVVNGSVLEDQELSPVS